MNPICQQCWSNHWQSFPNQTLANNRIGDRANGMDRFCWLVPLLAADRSRLFLSPFHEPCKLLSDFPILAMHAIEWASFDKLEVISFVRYVCKQANPNQKPSSSAESIALHTLESAV